MHVDNIPPWPGHLSHSLPPSLPIISTIVDYAGFLTFFLCIFLNKFMLFLVTK